MLISLLVENTIHRYKELIVKEDLKNLREEFIKQAGIPKEFFSDKPQNCIEAEHGKGFTFKWNKKNNSLEVYRIL